MMASFDNEIVPLLQAEGGLNTNKSDRGGLTKYGISQKAYPNLDIGSLTPYQAANIYKSDYWDKIGGDELPDDLAAVVFDTAVNHGVGTAKKMLQNSGGDIEGILKRRESLYKRLANDPTQKQFLPGWMNRLDNLRSRIGTMMNPIGTAQADEFQEKPLSYEEWEAQQYGQPSQQEKPLSYEEWEAKEYGNDYAGKDTLQAVRDIGGGVIKGASNIGNAILSAGDTYNEMIGNKNALSSLDTTGEQRRESMESALRDQRANPDSATYQAAELGTSIAGTAGVGEALGAAAAPIPILSRLATPIKTAGMKGESLMEKLIGGGISGAASTALVGEDPNAGALVGMALPPALAAVGKAGTGLAKTIIGSELPEETAKIAKKAIDQGLVIPPSQVKPSLTNRLLEGTAGKITTAQNASAKNQEIFNAMAKAEIGAESLTDEGLALVRSTANKSYDNIAKFGKIKADQGFKKAIDDAAARSEKFKADFPGLKNSDVDDLITSLKSKNAFNSDTTIEAIKRLRQDGAANKASMDAAKKELGRFQSKVAGSLEDLVDRNLEKAGKQALLTEYRDARKVLAKTYSIEKATDRATGNINAAALANELKKGKPLTGALKDIADFAQAFPKAAQNISKMGSLPQTSPLDVASVSTLSMIGGHPGYMALLAVRPAARKAVLSKIIQRNLTKTGSKSSKLAELGLKNREKIARVTPLLVQQGTQE